MSRAKKKRTRATPVSSLWRGRKPGTFLRITLADGSYGYGRLLEAPYTAFYDYRTLEPSSDLDAIAARPVLFSQAIRLRGEKRWEAIGWKELAGEVARPVVMFMQNVLDFQRCTIFDSAGMERAASPEECIGIEQAAVWEPQGIEKRLLDFFMGRPNEEELRSRVRLKPDDAD